MTGQYHAGPQWLRWQGGLHLGDLGLGRPAVHPQDGGNPLAAGAELEHQARLVQGQVAETAPDVARQHPQQARQQGGPQQRLVLAQRVGDAHRPAPRVTGGQLQPVVVGGRAERLAEHLDVARPGERAAHRAAQPLRGGQTVPGGGAGHPDRDVVITPSRITSSARSLGYRRSWRHDGGTTVSRSAPPPAPGPVTTQPTCSSRWITVAFWYGSPATRPG